MSVHIINPLLDNRWNEFASRHPKASVFHQRGWLHALARTYSYVPLAITTQAPDQKLADAIVLCGVCSWITGNRLVSLPFSDHCELLTKDPGLPSGIKEWLEQQCCRNLYKYVELRTPSNAAASDEFECSASFLWHVLNLEPSVGTIFEKLDKDSLQRRIRRAEREKLTYEVDGSEKLVGEFYPLLVRTRRRHGLIPQPIAWFRNLVDSMQGNVCIRLAKKNGRAIAGMLSLRHNKTVFYKYGCSDERFHCIAGVPFLFWHLIEESKAEGAEEIDFGRTDLENTGLINFKDHFGASKARLRYFRYSPQRRSPTQWEGNFSRFREMVSVLPPFVLPSMGRALYRHAG